ncbi:uncharacterized protein Z520_12015 [Fonsecaea multimorphosa CBS 102226]|uniref:DNA replication factor Cdt1 C-terminal domain-containing protein n=1 Tax=Fonsecaea multimorphosa CBS 102226 TaxID=1442371 RepID=A0A0D2JP71_9EURO|nr:uncharacterized protein Z520_12015 [Fonsecaea multimorphosa CBS 102226]KIX92269.1 hypothetical protein Z520_12015 [Fonsecaea multimorphosa CBS 102226]OAL17642.1 hypothetical protein AYO22_11432 [Fonsecaea multimorphosa]
MAPSLRGSSHRVSKRQTTVNNHSKISKASKAAKLPIALKSKLEEVVLGPVVPTKKSVKHVSKRKRDAVQDDSESEPGSVYVTQITAKKPKLQLPTPPSSKRENEKDSVDMEFSPTMTFRQLTLDTDDVEPAPQALPPVLQDFVSLHAAFLKAFTLHIVHNGQSTPADLGSLLNSVTRLWKKHTVAREDIQRMLAIYELDVATHFSGRLLTHQEGPFKLTMTGADFVRYNVEYVGAGGKRPANPRWDECGLQRLYEAEIEACWISQRNNSACWVHGAIRNFPRLNFDVGMETQVRKAKAETARREILGLSSEAQNRAGAQFSMHTSNNSESNEANTPRIVKDRTLSLLDRVRAKALVNSTMTAQSAEATLRRYAVGRIAEVVEILRMRQQRKLSSNFVSCIHSSPSKVRGKVSFSMHQLINDIKSSLAVPIGDAEVRMCIHILQDEVPGMWVSVYTVGTVESVILNGPGLSGAEVKKIIDEKEGTR